MSWDRCIGFFCVETLLVDVINGATDGKPKVIHFEFPLPVRVPTSWFKADRDIGTLEFGP